MEEARQIAERIRSELDGAAVLITHSDDISVAYHSQVYSEVDRIIMKQIAPLIQAGNDMHVNLNRSGHNLIGRLYAQESWESALAAAKGGGA